MKGNPTKNQEPMTFKNAVVFYLNKHKASDRIIKKYLKEDDDEQMGLFAAAIEYLRERQKEVSTRYDNEHNNRRASVKKAHK